ncbi:hypothetical protein LCGC14_1142330, partial [marine sediment metagenome]
SNSSSDIACIFAFSCKEFLKRIADDQMSYVGDGPTNDGNVMGWLSRFFISALMPF